MASVKELVAEKLVTDNNGEHVRNRVIDVLVKEEVERRVEATVKVTKMLHDAEAALKKISKPDNFTYNADGSEASAVYSKGRIDEIKKATEYEKKIAAALDRAYNNNDFEKVFELAK